MERSSATAYGILHTPEPAPWTPSATSAYRRIGKASPASALTRSVPPSPRTPQPQPGAIVREFVEVESGKRCDRPQLRAALAECRATKATLLIAKLDWLARNVAFTAGLMDSGVEFVAADNPHATRLTIHILAAVAEDEARRISARTVAALQAAKARGVRLGGAREGAGSATSTRKACEANQARAATHAATVRPYIDAAKKAGAVPLAQLAAALNARGITTATGRGAWSPMAVSRVLAAAA